MDGGGGAASRRIGLATALSRAADLSDPTDGRGPTVTGDPAGADGTERSVEVSVVNLTARPMLVYIALRHRRGGAAVAAEASGGGAADELVERALTPWEGAAPPAEQPAPLSVDPAAGRGANCLLLAPYEGTARCEAADAEDSPFGESNTFRFEARTGARLTLPPRCAQPRLVVEAAFQMAAAPSGQLSALLGTDYEDEAVAEAPFVVASVPLR